MGRISPPACTRPPDTFAVGLDLRVDALPRRSNQPPTRAMIQKVSLSAKFAAFADHWSPKIVGELNGQHVKLVKFSGAFVWHHHDHEDEMFLVHRGRFRMELLDGEVELRAGDFIVVPRGVEHRPVADEEVEIVLFEPAGTLNTGNVHNARTVAEPVRL